MRRGLMRLSAAAVALTASIVWTPQALAEEVGVSSEPVSLIRELSPVTVLAVSSLADEEIPTPYKECTIRSRAEFNGVRDTQTNLVSGVWEMVAGQDCVGFPDGNMSYMDVEGGMVKDGIRQYLLTFASCSSSDLFPTACDFEVTAGRHECVACNGVWIFPSSHTLELPQPFIWAPQPEGSPCSVAVTSPRTLNCNPVAGPLTL